MDFKVGDRVRGKESTKNSDNPDIPNNYGTILEFSTGSKDNYVLVEFDEKIRGGHNGRERGKLGHCWWCYPDELELPLPKTDVKPDPNFRYGDFLKIFGG